MKKHILVVVCLMLVSGCSVYKAANQPDKKDMSVLNVGTKRELVLAEFGNPVATGKEDDGSYDIFGFVQGYSSGSKAARAVGHGIADVFTLGLWEVVGTPIETVASGSKVKVKVVYDEDNRVIKAVELKTPGDTGSAEGGSAGSAQEQTATTSVSK